MFTQTIKNYDDSVSYEQGYFSTKVLTAKFYSHDKMDNVGLANLPLLSFRYNPTIDSGKGNAIWLHSSLTTSYDKPSIDKTLILQGLPLWQMLWGWLSYVQYVKKATDFFTSHIIVLQSPAIKPLPTVSPQQYYIPLSADFVNGKPPYNEPLTTWWRAHWYPNIYDQLPVLNAIVESGPLVPKYSQTKNSTWELKYTYNFLFKWGGPDITEPAVADPSQQQTYPVPDKQSETIQIRDPAKQKYQSILHSWDYRRGLIKESAFKRMQDNLSIDSTFEPDEPPKKEKKLLVPVLQSQEKKIKKSKHVSKALCEESTYQENPARNTNPAAHPAAARKAATAQVEHTQSNLRLERKTETATITNRLHKLTPFKPGFERETEEELSKAFKRPPRLFKEDTPFYPWLPRPVPLVNFHLNFKF